MVDAVAWKSVQLGAVDTNLLSSFSFTLSDSIARRPRMSDFTLQDGHISIPRLSIMQSPSKFYSEFWSLLVMQLVATRASLLVLLDISGIK